MPPAFPRGMFFSFFFLFVKMFVFSMPFPHNWTAAPTLPFYPFHRYFISPHLILPHCLHQAGSPRPELRWKGRHQKVVPPAEVLCGFVMGQVACGFVKLVGKSIPAVSRSLAPSMPHTPSLPPGRRRSWERGSPFPLGMWPLPAGPLPATLGSPSDLVSIHSPAVQPHK